MSKKKNVAESRSILFQPRAWPIAVKLAVALAFASLLPMLCVSYYNLSHGTAITAEKISEALEQLAASTGDRIDQLINDTKHTIAYFSWGEEVIQLVTSADKKNRLNVENKMSRLIDSYEDIELFMVLDRKGKVLAATKPQYEGRMLDFRDYFKEAVKGRSFISDLEVGTASNHPGMYFSAPVRNAAGNVAGVAVLKLKGEAVFNIMESARSREKRLVNFLVDSDGIIIYHPDADMLYHSITPLPSDLYSRIINERRFGNDVTYIPSFYMKELADSMGPALQPGHVKYFSAISKQPEIAGYARLSEKKWQIVVTEPEEVYAAPLQHLFFNAVKSVSLMGVIFLIFAILFARTFTRPLKALTTAAKAVEKGDLEHAKVQVTNRDELGQMAQTFNAMVDGIYARERERDIFGRMVSPEVREKLLKGDLKLGGENLRVSVLFSDIRGFSTMSEKMSPHDVVMLLNEYLTEMTEAVRPWGGYVNNFIGDAIVVIFGAPHAQKLSEWSAVNAALAMKARLEKLNERRKQMDDEPIVTGIGISTGKVVAGQIGSLERFMYTVIGDAVNVAARLEDLTKQFDDNPILLNAATYEGCKEKIRRIGVTNYGMQRVKGRVEPVHVYAVYGDKQTAPTATDLSQELTPDA